MHGKQQKASRIMYDRPDQRYIVASPPNLSPFNILQGFRFENINTNKVKKNIKNFVNLIFLK